VALNLGIDVPISLNNSMIQGILRFIKKDKIQSFHSISSSNIEVIQLKVTSSSRLLGKRIKEIKFPLHSLIISVKSGENDILPDGEYMIQGNDTVIMIVRKESLEKIENMFTS
jgi:trk system potassium uptake protein TrkA